MKRKNKHYGITKQEEFEILRTAKGVMSLFFIMCICTICSLSTTYQWAAVLTVAAVVFAVCFSVGVTANFLTHLFYLTFKILRHRRRIASQDDNLMGDLK